MRIRIGGSSGRCADIGRQFFETDHCAENIRCVGCGHSAVIVRIGDLHLLFGKFKQADNCAKDLYSICCIDFAVMVYVAKLADSNNRTVARIGVRIREVDETFKIVAVCKRVVKIRFGIVVERDLQRAFVRAVCRDRNLRRSFNGHTVAVKQIIGGKSVVALRHIIVQTDDFKLILLLFIAQVHNGERNRKDAGLLRIVIQVYDRICKVHRSGNGIFEVQNTGTRLSR